MVVIRLEKRIEAATSEPNRPNQPRLDRLLPRACNFLKKPGPSWQKFVGENIEAADHQFGAAQNPDPKIIKKGHQGNQAQQRKIGNNYGGGPAAIFVKPLERA